MGTRIVVLSANIFADSLFAPVPPAKPGYKIAAPEQPASASPAEAAEQAAPIETRFAGADVDRGKSIGKACISCHTLEKGGANKVGPNLWGVIDRSRASEPGYDYSAAMKSRGGKWTFEDLDKFLAHPQSYVAGTKMTYSRIQDPERRADLIGYLRTLSDNPVSLPTAPEKASPSGTREARRKIATAVFDDRVSASVFCLIHA